MAVIKATIKVDKLGIPFKQHQGNEYIMDMLLESKQFTKERFDGVWIVADCICRQSPFPIFPMQMERIWNFEQMKWRMVVSEQYNNMA